MERIEHSKVFISYVWSFQKYQMKVLAFAIELMNDGVNVLLDKWSMNVTNEINNYVEKRVNEI